MPEVPPPSQPENEESASEETAPPKNVETDLPELRKAHHFWRIFDELPRDLSGVDLQPLYTLALTGDEIRAVNDREDSWEPRPEHRLSHTYPGPIGKLALPSARNLDRWNMVHAQAKKVHRSELKDYLSVVNEGEGHKALVMAMHLLCEAAFSQGGIEKGDNIFVPKGVTSEDVAASLAALRVVQMAADELGRLAEVGIKRQREYLVAELDTFGRLRGQTDQIIPFRPIST